VRESGEGVRESRGRAMKGGKPEKGLRVRKEVSVGRSETELNKKVPESMCF